jgi:hypothetical protein
MNEKLREYQKQYYQKNKEKLREYHRQYQIQYYQDNREKYIKYYNQYYKDNREKMRALARGYYHKHKYDPSYSHFITHRAEIQNEKYKKKHPYKRTYITAGRLIVEGKKPKFFCQVNKGQYTIELD